MRRARDDNEVFIYSRDPSTRILDERAFTSILQQITAKHYRLSIWEEGHVSPGGMRVLLAGLDHNPNEYSTPTGGNWGLKGLSIDNCAVTEESFQQIMDYIKRDTRLRVLQLFHNCIKLDDAATAVAAINASHITQLDLGCNPLCGESVIHLFNNLHNPQLKTLNLVSCNLDDKAAPSVACYLRSLRSRNLRSLALEGNAFTGEGMRIVIDAIETSHYTLIRLKLNDDGAWAPDLAIAAQNERVQPLLDRNFPLFHRARQAALRTLPVARVLLNASGASTFFPSHTLTLRPRAFRILDLPDVALRSVVRHASGDAAALSNAQFARLAKDATGKEGLRRVIEEGKVDENEWCKDDRKRSRANEPREKWLRWGRWDTWERDVYQGAGV